MAGAASTCVATAHAWSRKVASDRVRRADRPEPRAPQERASGRKRLGMRGRGCVVEQPVGSGRAGDQEAPTFDQRPRILELRDERLHGGLRLLGERARDELECTDQTCQAPPADRVQCQGRCEMRAGGVSGLLERQRNQGTGSARTCPPARVSAAWAGSSPADPWQFPWGQGERPR